MTPAKILLFGEYTILTGSQALAIPFMQFSCSLVKKNNPALIQPTLQQFVEYLLNNSQQFDFLNLSELEHDLRAGLGIDSNIPIQYGVGSSGALTAELYRHYAWTTEKSLAQILAELASMEAFMHGTSSGIDPLVCFIQKPLLFAPNSIQRVTLPPHSFAWHIFLIDTQVKASTRNYVSQFLNRYRHDTHFTQQINQLSQWVGQCIHSFVNATPQFAHNIYNLCQLQYQVFPFLYPPALFTLLQKGLNQKLFYAKLCGSGGGGFILGFTQNPQEVQRFFDLSNYPIHWI